MTDNELTLLEALWGRVERAEDEWARPMDVGGTTGSYHGTYLARMTEKGWVERKRRDGAAVGRGSFLYRITAAGRDALHNAKALAKVLRK